MAGTDPADTHGHDLDSVAAEYPTATLTPIADEFPLAYGDFSAFGSGLFLAQDAAEVQAQIDNEPGGSGD